MSLDENINGFRRHPINSAYLFLCDAAKFFYSNWQETINAFHKDDTEAWVKKFDALGKSIVSEANKRFSTDKMGYGGGTSLKHPLRYTNNIIFSLYDVNLKNHMRGKPLLTLVQRHNGVPEDTIEVILQTRDEEFSIIAEDKIRGFNAQEPVGFLIKHYSGERFTQLKYG